MAVPTSFELSRLDTNTFEHLVNLVAMHVLGPGHTGFGPGPDGGRDGFFEGLAPYPSEAERWDGVWYLQSKFHAPHLSKDPQKWILERIAEEIAAFNSPHSRREWPTNWIIATNIDVSGAAKSGTFDKARALVRKARPELANRFHIWGGQKLLHFIGSYPDIGKYYGAYLTPGQFISDMYKSIQSASAQGDDILRHLIVTEFGHHQFTKLEQAGSTADNRPSIQKLFTDLPFQRQGSQRRDFAASFLAKTLAQNHRVRSIIPDTEAWTRWQRDPERARTWIIKGGPGQGKSTLTQYVSQIHRAAFILSADGPLITPTQRTNAEEVAETAKKAGLWPLAPRIPVSIELKLFAQWLGELPPTAPKKVLSYLLDYIHQELGQPVQSGTLKKLFGEGRWLFVFDGLDEVPGDIKDLVAQEVVHFVDNVLVGCDCDAAIICTSRPQGYSGQFNALMAATVELSKLSPEEALECATPLLEFGRSTIESRNYIGTLRDALNSASIAQLMTTPLQSHIMAIIVRDGGRPPERRWQLFNTFYNIIKKREANRNLPDPRLAKLLREGDTLIKALHNRLGFELHARAETKAGAVTSLKRDEFLRLVTDVVTSLQDEEIEETVTTLMEAATERLVLVNTPESGESVRFDIRQLQEFFAAEQIFDSFESNTFVERLQVIVGDSHWREVVHFIISAVVENNRKAEVPAIAATLAQLDSGDLDGSRTFRKSLARGGIIASRLLQEGVLESDKRIRSQFAICLTSLLSSHEVGESLEGTVAPHSRNWLNSVLLTALEERSESEVFGAAYTVVWTVQDDDPRCKEAQRLVSKMSLAFKVALFEASASYGDDERLPHPSWFGKIALDLLLEPEWADLGDNVELLLQTVLATENVEDLISRHVGPKTAGALRAMFNSDVRERARTDTDQDTHPIIVKRLAAPPTELDWVAWEPAQWQEIANSTGLFRAIHDTFALVRSPNEQNLSALLASVGSQEKLAYLPAPISSFLNKSVSAIVDLDAVKATSNPYPGHELMRFVEPRKGSLEYSDEQWLAEIIKEPLILWHFLYSNEYEIPVHILELDSLVDAIPLLLESIGSYSFLLPSLGEIIGKFPRFGTALLEHFAQVDVDLLNHYYRELSPFTVKLPAHQRLLPNIVAMCVMQVGPAFFSSSIEGRRGGREKVADLLKKYFPDIQELSTFVDKKPTDAIIEAAATMALLLHPNCEAEVADDRIVELLQSKIAGWYVPAVAHYLAPRIAKQDIEAMGTISRMMDAVRGEPKARNAFNWAVRSWRELSYGSVTNDPDRAKWF